MLSTLQLEGLSWYWATSKDEGDLSRKQVFVWRAMRVGYTELETVEFLRHLGVS